MSKKHKHDDHEEHVDESWLIPYADLLTLLLALFIVLYAVSAVDAKKFDEMSQAFNIALNSGSGLLEKPTIVETGPDTIVKKKKPEDKETEKDKTQEQIAEEKRQALIKQEQEDLEKLKKQLDNYIKQNGLTNDLNTKLNQSQLMIIISDNALFDSGSDALKGNSKELATAISELLKAYDQYEIVVAGHTDNVPIYSERFKSNWDLSSSRAIRFMDVLLQNKSLKPQRFSAIGYGEYHPVATNDTTSGRAKNRRVEVSIIRKYVDMENQQQIPATPKQ